MLETLHNQDSVVEVHGQCEHNEEDIADVK
jgi:hypothetical protein